MGLLDRIRRLWNLSSTTLESADMNSDELLEWLGIDSETKWKNLNEATYYACIKVLSETMGKLPIKYYQDTERGRIRAAPTDVTTLLTVCPNDIMTPSTLWSTVEMNCQHYGNGYVWLRGSFKRNGQYGGSYKIIDMWPMQSSYVQVLRDDAGIFGGTGQLYYQYNDPRTGELYVFNQNEVLHFKTWFSLDGVMGYPVKEILGSLIDGSHESQTYMNNLYKNGLTASMAIQYTGDLDEPQRKKLSNRYANLMTGPKNAGKVIPVPIGLTLTPLKMSLTDAQFAELKEYSALQIASAFGIKPNQINNYDKSSYANSESRQLDFLVNTMSFRLKMYEEEINKKMLTPKQQKSGYLYKFNEKALLRTNSETQVQMLSNAVNNGIYTPNEARGYLDLPAEEGGDVLMVNGNYIPITQVGTQYGQGGENSGN
ncbi:MAG: phage portal protein [Lachnospiraceae bacterium]|nr:phage portal protein [Lachnospiraceae bacterium]